MGKAVETVAPPPPVVEEQPSPPEDPPGPTTLISSEQLQQIDAAESAEQRVEILQGALGVHHYPVNPRTSVWVDFCFGVLNFARDEAHLPPEKTLCLLTLAHEVYVFATQSVSEQVPAADSSVTKLAEPVPDDSMMATRLDAYPTVETIYGHFRGKVRLASGVEASGGNSQDQPPLATPFSPMQVARIVTFFTSTFFRHLRAYQYVSRVPRPSIVRESLLPTETPLRPAPLADATLLE